MGQKFKCILLMCLLLTIAHQTEGKRSISGRSRSSSSSSRGSTRRTSSSSQTHYSPPPSSSVNKPSISHAPNADHVKLTYGGLNSQPNRPSISQSAQNKPPIGWNVQQNQPAVNKPPLNAGPPPAYSSHNTPGGAKTNIHEPPPAYKPNNAAPPSYPGNNQQSASYPKQTYNTASGYPHSASGGYPHNTGTGAHSSSHNTGFRPRNGTGGFGGVHSPIYTQTVRPVAAGPGSYHPQGSIQPGFYPHQTSGFPTGGHPPPPPPGGFPPGIHPIGGGYAYPQQSAPVYAGSGIQPGFYPAGSFPVKSSSGPGFGTGLVAGALGGAILGHALTPTGGHHHVVAAPNAPADAQDRIIIINNTPGQPATVTNAAGQPASGVNVIQSGGQPTTNTGGTSGVSEPPVPLAPFPNTQQQAQPYPAGGATTGAAAGAVGTSGSTVNYPDGMVPLAPFPNSNTTEQPNAQANANNTQPQYGTYCVPVLVNVTDPNNTANVTTVEQVYCYQVMLPPSDQQMAPVQNSSSSVPQQQQPDLMPMPGNYNPPSNDISNLPTQKTSTASLAANSQIKSGVKSFTKASSSTSILDTIIMTIILFSASYCMH